MFVYSFDLLRPCNTKSTVRQKSHLRSGPRFAMQKREREKEEIAKLLFVLERVKVKRKKKTKTVLLFSTTPSPICTSTKGNNEFRPDMFVKT